MGFIFGEVREWLSEDKKNWKGWCNMSMWFFYFVEDETVCLLTQKLICVGFFVGRWENYSKSLKWNTCFSDVDCSKARIVKLNTVFKKKSIITNKSCLLWRFHWIEYISMSVEIEEFNLKNILCACGFHQVELVDPFGAFIVVIFFMYFVFSFFILMDWRSNII